MVAGFTSANAISVCHLSTSRAVSSIPFHKKVLFYNICRTPNTVAIACVHSIWF